MMQPHLRGNLLIIWIPAYAGMKATFLMNNLGLTRNCLDLLWLVVALIMKRGFQAGRICQHFANARKAESKETNVFSIGIIPNTQDIGLINWKHWIYWVWWQPHSRRRRLFHKYGPRGAPRMSAEFRCRPT